MNSTTSSPRVFNSCNNCCILLSKSPLYLVPPTSDPRFSWISLLHCPSCVGTSPAWILLATSSTTAVFPTPGWPSRHTFGLFLRERTRRIRSTSLSRPYTVSSLPAAAMATKSVPNRTNAGCSSSELPSSCSPVPLLKVPKGSPLSRSASACFFAPPLWAAAAFEAWDGAKPSPTTRNADRKPMAVRPLLVKSEARPLAGSNSAAHNSSSVMGPGGPFARCARVAWSRRGTLPCSFNNTACDICRRSSVAMPGISAPHGAAAPTVANVSVIKTKAICAALHVLLPSASVAISSARRSVLQTSALKSVAVR
mmetsp:Transcript_34715/g.79574  ORF Transcript_34715/g.79574 Transcript_34715/m.79574 type:complete len:310 (+) Transcript_34715:586-1515(+)